jgi:putative intracellular protease/amidase
LLAATDAAGASILASRHATAFTNAEERAAGLTDVVPFLLETRMRELGAVFKNAPDFQPFSIADGQLVTGQNPASATRTAELVMERLRQK